MSLPQTKLTPTQPHRNDENEGKRGASPGSKENLSQAPQRAPEGTESIRDSQEIQNPLSRVKNSQSLRVPDTFEHSPSRSSLSLSALNHELKTASVDENDGLAESSQDLLWDVSALLDSLQLRLSRVEEGGWQQRLFETPPVLSALQDVLEEAATASSLEEGQKQVLRYLSEAEKKTPWLNAEELWAQLEPLLVLRKSSMSLTALPTQSRQLQAIQEEEKEWLERRAREKAEEEQEEPESELWDWENNDSEMNQFISSAVVQLAHASRSSDALPESAKHPAGPPEKDDKE